MQSQIFRRLQSVPSIVHVVLTQTTRRRAEGSITDATFNEQIARIIREELEPRKLKLLTRDLPSGRTRFIVKECDTGIVCDMLKFSADGMLESEASDSFVEEAQAVAH